MVDRVLVPAVAYGASSTLIGLGFESVASGGTGLAGSVPIAGKVQLSALQFTAAVNPGSAVDPFRVRLGLASEIPTTSAEMDAAELVFPAASSVFATRGWLLFIGALTFEALGVWTLLNMNGRRIVGEVYNAGVVVADMYVRLALHGVEGGAVSGDPAFLAGEEVERV